MAGSTAARLSYWIWLVSNVLSLTTSSGVNPSGLPQTHFMWRDIAPLLVCAELHGYGASACRPSPQDRLRYSKRATAAEMVEAMSPSVMMGKVRHAFVRQPMQRGPPRRIVEICGGLQAHKKLIVIGAACAKVWSGHSLSKH
jgi:hypothetical protein